MASVLSEEGGTRKSALQRSTVIPVGETAEEDTEARPPRRGAPERRKAEKQPRTPPAGIPIPTRGLPAARYKLNQLVGRPDRVPKLNKKEQFEYDVLQLEDRLRFLAERLQITICFLNVKGGASKTTTAIYVGSVITDITKLTGYVLPATQSTATSTAALNAGISPNETLTISEFARRVESLQSYRDLSKLVRPTQFGLRVIAEDPVEKVSLSNEFHEQQFGSVAATLQRNADVVIYDTGNDNVELGSVPLAAVRDSDVLVFTATVGNEETLEKLSHTMRLYMSDETSEFQPFSEAGERSSVDIPTAEKASKSIVVVSRTNPSDGPEAFVDYTKRRDRNGTVIGEIGFDGDILTVPEDDYLADNVVADLSAITDSTYYAYLQLAVAIYEKAAELKGVHLPDTD